MAREIVILNPMRREGWFRYNYCLIERQLLQMSSGSLIGTFADQEEIQNLNPLPRLARPKVLSRKRTAKIIPTKGKINLENERLIVILPLKKSGLKAMQNASIEELLVAQDAAA